MQVTQEGAIRVARPHDQADARAEIAPATGEAADSAPFRSLMTIGRTDFPKPFPSVYDLIVQSDEADLVRDVCFDIDKAQTKLKAVRRRLQGVQEQAAAKVQLLTAADTKLTATIVAALLSTRGGNASA
jgi:hypothetical protein